MAGESSSLTNNEGHQEWGTKENLRKATYLLLILQAVLLVLFFNFSGSEHVTYGTATQAYNFFIGVEIMMFIGFGYLMTFLKWYGLGAVGFTMLITAVGIQWYLFTGSFFTQYWAYGADFSLWSKAPMNMYSLIDSLFGISAVLITFGALIGKVSPLQLMVITVIELALHAANAKCLMEGFMKVEDLGGTYAEHMFGAYFGLAVAYVLGKPSGSPVMGTVPDLFSLVGTLFLWIYWPSFVSGAAVPDSPGQEMAIVNTILALSSSTLLTFLLSNLFSHDGRFRPVDIQNATLAGGVAIGCSANLNLTPFAAIVIGLIAGGVSAFGFNFIQPWLEEKVGLHDTCGIHNLHAMPSVVGALCSIFVAGTSFMQVQFVSILVCIGFAVSTGLITGFIAKAVGDAGVPEFHDQVYWEVAGDYNAGAAEEGSAHPAEKKGPNGYHSVN